MIQTIKKNINYERDIFKRILNSNTQQHKLMENESFVRFL